MSVSRPDAAAKHRRRCALNTRTGESLRRVRARGVGIGGDPASRRQCEPVVLVAPGDGASCVGTCGRANQVRAAVITPKSRRLRRPCRRHRRARWRSCWSLAIGSSWELELQLEELEATATEDDPTAEKAVAKTTSVTAFARKRPSGKPFSPNSRASGCSLKVVPRQWNVVQMVREKFSRRDCETIAQAGRSLLQPGRPSLYRYRSCRRSPRVSS